MTRTNLTTDIHDRLKALETMPESTPIDRQRLSDAPAAAPEIPE